MIKCKIQIKTKNLKRRLKRSKSPMQYVNLNQISNKYRKKSNPLLWIEEIYSMREILMPIKVKEKMVLILWINLRLKTKSTHMILINCIQLMAMILIDNSTHPCRRDIMDQKRRTCISPISFKAYKMEWNIKAWIQSMKTFLKCSLIIKEIDPRIAQSTEITLDQEHQVKSPREKILTK